MPYYSDVPYYYGGGGVGGGGGAYANHSSLIMTTGRTPFHTPLSRFSPHLSTISESPLNHLHRFSPISVHRHPRRVIDTADIDVSSPRMPTQHDRSRPGNRLRRDRPTIKIRSQALKDNPALREHYEKHEKSVGELLMEKFLIKDKKQNGDKGRGQGTIQLYRQVSLDTGDSPTRDSNYHREDEDGPDTGDEAVQRAIGITRRFTRRRSSADLQLDPEQLQREAAYAQVQAKVLDSLVAEEQARIENEVRRGTLIKKGTSPSGKRPMRNESATSAPDDTTPRTTRHQDGDDGGEKQEEKEAKEEQQQERKRKEEQEQERERKEQEEEEEEEEEKEEEEEEAGAARMRKTTKKRRKKPAMVNGDEANTCSESMSNGQSRGGNEEEGRKDEGDGKDPKVQMYKIEACNSVGDFSTILMNATPTTADSNNERESTQRCVVVARKCPGTRSARPRTLDEAEAHIVLPMRKPYVTDRSRNSVYLTVRKPTGKLDGSNNASNVRDNREKTTPRSVAPDRYGATELESKMGSENCSEATTGRRVEEEEEEDTAARGHGATSWGKGGTIVEPSKANKSKVQRNSVDARNNDAETACGTAMNSRCMRPNVCRALVSASVRIPQSVTSAAVAHTGALRTPKKPTTGRDADDADAREDVANKRNATEMRISTTCIDAASSVLAICADSVASNTLAEEGNLRSEPETMATTLRKDVEQDAPAIRRSVARSSIEIGDNFPEHTSRNDNNVMLASKSVMAGRLPKASKINTDRNNGVQAPESSLRETEAEYLATNSPKRVEDVVVGIVGGTLSASSLSSSDANPNEANGVGASKSSASNVLDMAIRQQSIALDSSMDESGKDEETKTQPTRSNDEDSARNEEKLRGRTDASESASKMVARSGDSGDSDRHSTFRFNAKASGASDLKDAAGPESRPRAKMDDDAPTTLAGDQRSVAAATLQQRAKVLANARKKATEEKATLGDKWRQEDDGRLSRSTSSESIDFWSAIKAPGSPETTRSKRHNGGGTLPREARTPAPKICTSGDSPTTNADDQSSAVPVQGYDDKKEETVVEASGAALQHLGRGSTPTATRRAKEVPRMQQAEGSDHSTVRTDPPRRKKSPPKRDDTSAHVASDTCAPPSVVLLMDDKDAKCTVRKKAPPKRDDTSAHVTSDTCAPPSVGTVPLMDDKDAKCTVRKKAPPKRDDTSAHVASDTCAPPSVGTVPLMDDKDAKCTVRKKASLKRDDSTLATPAAPSASTVPLMDDKDAKYAVRKKTSLKRDDSTLTTSAAPATVPLINVVATSDDGCRNVPSDDEDHEDPGTPTNDVSLSDQPNCLAARNMRKWSNRRDLTTNEADDMEMTPVASQEASLAASPVITPQASSKTRRVVRRKKQATASTSEKESRKVKPATRGDVVAADAKTALTHERKQLLTKPSPRSSPRNQSPSAQRPLDLIRMFYTTPSALLTATPRDLSKVTRAKIKRKRHHSKTRTPSVSSDSTGSTTSTATTESSGSTCTELDDDPDHKRMNSTRSNDSGFDGSPRISNCDMACHKKCEKLTGNLCGLNQKLVAEALQALKRAPSQSSDNQRNSDSSDHFTSGRITPPATNLPRFKKYAVTDFNFLKVLGKGSFGKVLLAELRGTECVYAVKCLKKDVVLEDDDVECTLIERKVLTLATRHPYLCHLFCTFQTESHLFFVMEYLNGGDLMFHIQKSGRFPEVRARFYAAEIWSGLNFLHKKGIVYRDLKLDNVLLDFEGHIRIADFGMCKLQIFLDRTADTFCGTPDYMAPEIIKGLKYNQAVDWWSYGVLLYEMLTGQSPFSGCDEDELFWSICNERPFIPRYLSQEATDMLVCLLEKDSGKRPPSHEIATHAFFQQLPWDRLERRQLEPPFKPALDHTLDTRYFDTAFTAERPRLTPVPEQILTSMDQDVFRGFSYTNPNATD